MRRRGVRSGAWLALALAAACGSEAKPTSGPLDRIRLPTGMAVHRGGAQARLLVASSNGDLLYDEKTGGAVLSLDPGSLTTPAVTGALNVHSFAGDLALARSEERGAGVPDAEACGTAIRGGPGSALAVFATRGSNTLNVLSVAPDGRVACERCGMPTPTGVADPLAVAVACGGGRARAFVGYLATQSGAAVVTELDLSSGVRRTATLGAGPVRAFAYDRDRDRLYVVGLATGAPTPLRWIDLAGCTVGASLGSEACTVGEAAIPSPASGVELRSIALANPAVPGTPRAPGVPLRAYATARLYDLPSASAAGARTTDLGGVLLVLDLVETSAGRVEPRVVWTWPIGRGAQEVRVLPPRAGRRDVVAALSVSDGVLWIYDDETRSVAAFGREAAAPGATGAPVLGHDPFGLAVDPAPVGSAARVWVGSYRDGFVTPVDVPLDAPDQASFAGGAPVRITGGTP
jgi:hypothetical protein